MTSLCHTCKVEHATDKVRVHCTKCNTISGTGFPDTCVHYQPTREKQLEDALRELCDSLTNGLCLKIDIHSDSKEKLQRVAKALVDARELLGKASR